MRKLRHFQQLGHTVIFLIGDSTALIGDPTGKNQTRKPLTREEIATNAETYKAQVFKILDRDKTEVRYNSEWLDKLSYYDIVKLMSRFTLSQMIEREDFHKRFANEEAISLHELMYPVMQGYDSVALKCDVELGGTDQKFNLMRGRDQQRHAGQKPQIILMTPILEGLDGVQKMSKSLGNAIGINDPAKDMYRKLMSISDELMWKYYDLLTDFTGQQIAAFKAHVTMGTYHPMHAKKQLAHTITADFYSVSEADHAAESWANEVQQKGVAEDAQQSEVPIRAVITADAVYLDNAEQDMNMPVHVDISRLLVHIGICPSRKSAMTQVAAGVTIDGVKTCEKHLVVAKRPHTFHVKVGRQQRIVTLT
jgi:tyrosyl-tRNA synthetase